MKLLFQLECFFFNQFNCQKFFGNYTTSRDGGKYWSNCSNWRPSKFNKERLICDKYIKSIWFPKNHIFFQIDFRLATISTAREGFNQANLWNFTSVWYSLAANVPVSQHPQAKVQVSNHGSILHESTNKADWGLSASLNRSWNVGSVLRQMRVSIRGLFHMLLKFRDFGQDPLSLSELDRDRC